MSYVTNMDALFKPRSCRIVFTNDSRTGEELIALIQEKDSRFIAEPGKKFAEYQKLGLLKIKNSSSLYSLISKTEYIKEVREKYRSDTVDHSIKREILRAGLCSAAEDLALDRVINGV